MRTCIGVTYKKRGLVPPGRVQNAFGQVIGADDDGAADFEVEEDGGEK